MTLLSTTCQSKCIQLGYFFFFFFARYNNISEGRVRVFGLRAKFDQQLSFLVKNHHGTRLTWKCVTRRTFLIIVFVFGETELEIFGLRSFQEREVVQKDGVVFLHSICIYNHTEIGLVLCNSMRRHSESTSFDYETLFWSRMCWFFVLFCKSTTEFFRESILVFGYLFYAGFTALVMVHCVNRVEVV